MSKKVRHARLHTTLFLGRNVGDLGDKLDHVENMQGKVKSLSMEWSDTTLDIAINNEYFISVPHANVKYVEWFKD